MQDAIHKFGITLGLLIAVLFQIQGAHADTLVTTHLTRDTRWTLENSPYVIQTHDYNISVTPSTTLTIEPGVVVKFSPRTGLDIQGRLVAQGTLQKPILFTSIYDKPEPYNTAYPGDWYGIFVRGAAASTIKYITIKYAGRKDFMSYPKATSLMLNGSGHEVDHATIEQGDGNGIWLQYAYRSKITASHIKTNRLNGILANHSQNNDVSRNTIEINQGDGLQLVNLADGLYHDNEISGNEGNGIFMDTLMGPDIHDNHIFKNDKNGIEIHTGYPRIHSNAIDHNQNGIVIAENWPQIINYNDIFKNLAEDFAVQKFNPKYSVVNAQSNWWGTSHGPLDHKTSKHIDASEWLTSSTTKYAQNENEAAPTTTNELSLIGEPIFILPSLPKMPHKWQTSVQRRRSGYWVVR